jgi:predicted RNA-binding protein (TIGR00451 family)
MVCASDLLKIRGVADYQFGDGTGTRLFPDDVVVTHSRNTGKIRHIHLNEELLATLRPTTGLFVLTVAGAKRLILGSNPLHLWVKLEDFAEPFVVKGRSAFAKHVIDADEEIRANEEVVVISQKNDVLAVGRALLTGAEMKAFERGVAVRIRRGAAEKS